MQDKTYKAFHGLVIWGTTVFICFFPSSTIRESKYLHVLQLNVILQTQEACFSGKPLPSKIVPQLFPEICTVSMLAVTRLWFKVRWRGILGNRLYIIISMFSRYAQTLFICFEFPFHVIIFSSCFCKFPNICWYLPFLCKYFGYLRIHMHTVNSLLTHRTTWHTEAAALQYLKFH